MQKSKLPVSTWSSQGGKFKNQNSQFAIRNSQSGITLIELIIYIAIMSVGFLVVATLTLSTLRAQDQSNQVTGVNENLRFAFEKITQAIRSASSVNSPTLGNSANSLSLVVGGTNTVFDVSSGPPSALRITEGANPPIDLTADGVTVSSFSVTNIANNGGKTSIRIQMTVQNYNPLRPELNFTRTGQTTATLK